MSYIYTGYRWLDNEQAAADSANFMASVKFDGIDEDLTAPGTPWIYYGVSTPFFMFLSPTSIYSYFQGSYAGARAAHMKVLYPDLVFGSIASSGLSAQTSQYIQEPYGKS